jgi:hypothetical protein
MAQVTGPSVIPRVGIHSGSKGIRLDVSQDDRLVRVVLDHWALEASLPDVARTAMTLVTAPGVGDREGLQDSANRLAGFRSQQQMEVIGHEAITKQPERITLLGVGEGLQEGHAIIVVAEDVGAVIAAIEGVVNEGVVDGAR